MSGETLARRVLVLDAAYCAAGGVIVAAAFGPVAGLLHAPPTLVLATGAAAIAWAGVVYGLARRREWRRPVAAVATANVAAAAAIAVLAVASPRIAAQLLLAAVACEVAAFATAQVVALRR